MLPGHSDSSKLKNVLLREILSYQLLWPTHLLSFIVGFSVCDWFPVTINTNHLLITTNIPTNELVGAVLSVDNISLRLCGHSAVCLAVDIVLTEMNVPVKWPLCVTDNI